MLSVDLSMLSFMMCLFFEMVDYCSSYAEMRLDVVCDSCSIHVYCCVLMEIIAGFMLAMLR